MKRRRIVIAILLLAVVAIGTYTYLAFFKTARNNSLTANVHYVVGVINNGPTLAPIFEGLKAGLTARGYTEGSTIEYRLVDNVTAAGIARQTAEQFISEKVNLIVALGIIPAKAATLATADLAPKLPVFIVSSDPVGNGLILSLNEPGGNVTGLTPGNETISGRRVELVKQLLPATRRIIYPYNNPKTSGLAQIESAAKSLDLALVAFEIQTPDELKQKLSSFAFRPGDVLMRATDSILAAAAPDMVAIARANKIPLIGNSSSDASHGSLMAYGADYHDFGVQGSRLVEKILQGENPGKIPVELPGHFVVAINLKTAKELGITVSTSFLRQANQIIPAN